MSKKLGAPIMQCDSTGENDNPPGRGILCPGGVITAYTKLGFLRMYILYF